MSHRLLPTAVAALWAGLVLPAAALRADAQQLGRADSTVPVRMTDNRYSVKTLRVKKGSTVTLRFTNRGSLLHEAVVGNHADQVAHNKEMVVMGSMVMPDNKNEVSVKAGASKTLRYRFDRTGVFEIACHIPGHYKAGMRIDVVVS